MRAFAERFIGWLLRWDESAAGQLNAAIRRRSHRLQRLTAGLAGSLAAVEVVLMLALAAMGHVRTALRMLLAVATVYGLVELLGRVFARGRPFEGTGEVQELLKHEPGRSFPSRHVASGVAMAAIAADVAPGAAKLMLAVAVLLGVSRVASGLHYPGDVLAGALLGKLVGNSWRTRRGA